MDAEDRENRLVRGLTWALVALATIAAELATAEPERPRWASWTIAATFCAGALSVHRWIGARKRSRIADRPIGIVALLLLCISPFGSIRPLEIMLLDVLRNLGLGMAAMSHRPSFDRLAALISLFLVLIASALAEGIAVPTILGAYAAAGSLWLTSAYWHRRPPPATPNTSGRLPIAALGSSGIAIGAVVLLATAGPSRAATALAGLVPSSGGTLWDDPNARGGVNDGENEVKGAEHPESIGFAESDVYLDTDRPSLYDAFNDMYGEPSRPKQYDRMVAIGNQNVIEQGERPAENLRAGRQFSLVRRPRDQYSRRPSTREADAFLYLKGQAPVHLGLAAYGHFDGRDWDELPPCDRDCPLIAEAGAAPWFRIDHPPMSIFAGNVAHQVKIGTLDSAALPVPAHLHRFRVGQVNQPDFFRWSHEGMIRMSTRTIPSGTVIEAETRTIDPERLREIPFSPMPLRAASPDTEYRIDPRVIDLASTWIAGAPPGWQEIEAVVARLRGHAMHDRLATIPPDCNDVVADFLLRSRRGPDYLFATAAATILRGRGYRTRLVSGLYADPAKYDPRTRHTPVGPEDVHVWAEVNLPNGIWVAIEPTPGYRLPEPPPSWLDILRSAWSAAIRWGRDHAIVLSIAGASLAILIRRRRAVLDLLETLAWRIRLAVDPRTGLLKTLHLVERRSRLAGFPRPAGTTPRRWYGPILPRHSGLAADFDRLLVFTEWHLYAPMGVPPRADEDPRAICRRVVAGCTRRKLRDLASMKEMMAS